MSRIASMRKNTKRVIASGGSLGLVYLLVLQLAFFPAVAQGRAASPGQQREPLGSLSVVGEARVNDAQPPAESTIFSGDTLRTGQNGTATFATSGKGSLKIFPESLVSFPGNPQYLADVKSGMAVMSSQSGSAGITVRAGNSVVVAVTQGEQSTSKIEAALDGSFLISCLDGSIGVIPLEGASGLFIQAGQSVRISSKGELSAVEKPATPPAEATATTAPAQQTSVQKKSNAGWILLAVAGGAGAAAAAAKAGGGGGSSPVSPAH